MDRARRPKGTPQGGEFTTSPKRRHSDTSFSELAVSAFYDDVAESFRSHLADYKIVPWLEGYRVVHFEDNPEDARPTPVSKNEAQRQVLDNIRASVVKEISAIYTSKKVDGFDTDELIDVLVTRWSREI